MHLRPALQRLGLRTAVFQAPIGGMASPKLAAAVAEAGGVGHLACTWRTPDQLAALLRQLAHKVPVVSFFWGDAPRYVTRVKAAGALTI